MKKISKISALVIIFALFLPILLAPIQAQAAVQKDQLQYYLFYNQKTNEAQFLVTNPTKNKVNLQFPSGKDFDLEIKKNNQVIWKASEGKFYTQALRNEKLNPGQAKFFKIELPKLTNGKYDLYAYFEGSPTRSNPAASLNITVSNGIEDPLKYSLWYDKDANKAYLLLQNTGVNYTKLSFPNAKEFDFQLINNKGKSIWKYSDGLFYGQALKTEWLAPGKTKLYSAELPKNFSGQYTLKAYFNGINGLEIPAASIKVSLDKIITKNSLSFSAWYSTQTKPKLVFSAENTSNQVMKFQLPTSQIVEVIVRGNNGFVWKFSEGIKFAQSPYTRELYPKSPYYSFIYLPELPKGNYKAEIYYLGYSKTTPAVKTNFSI
ncbi:MAG: hypothetical protein VR72_00270 [Clostridiaceae bacterium BRH_c20a]|nr:MAG: hypothetical protein VR72_00270 [Clostridiaceae bacterium BRH_c20a]